MEFDLSLDTWFIEGSYTEIYRTLLLSNEKYYLGILNSKVLWFFLKNTGTELSGGYFRFKTNYLKPFPLPDISPNASEMIEKVNFQLSQNELFQRDNNKLNSYLQSTYSISKLPKKLQNKHVINQNI